MLKRIIGAVLPKLALLSINISQTLTYDEEIVSRVSMLNEDPFFAVTAERCSRSTASGLSRQQSAAPGTTASRQIAYGLSGHISLHARFSLSKFFL
ncbi:hypothetical protein TNCV_594751 [Trichonephila clavipes]|nr:hypothetical protein TNCV_594751 [Trichonephila clavipes]